MKDQTFQLPFVDEEELSKTQLKNYMLALQALGARLTGLNPADLADFPLSDRLAAEIAEYRRLKGNGALRRQTQLIGKLMRDEDVEAIVEALNALNPASGEANTLLHLCEHWRTRLIDDNEALQVFVSEYALANDQIQPLRQAINAARKEQNSEKKEAYRKLFQRIKQYIADA